MKPATNNTIALFAMLMGAAVVVYVFAASRADPGLRMAALVSATTAGATLLAIASTLLTGKDLSNKENHQPPVNPTPPPSGDQPKQ